MSSKWRCHHQSRGSHNPHSPARTPDPAAYLLGEPFPCRPARSLRPTRPTTTRIAPPDDPREQIVADGGGRSQEDDVLTLLFLVVGAVSLGILNVGAISPAVVGWLLEHQVLVPATQAMVVLPGDAGLDIRRLALLAGVTVLVAAMLVSRRRRDKAPQR